jgi:hypothetical protein
MTKIGELEAIKETTLEEEIAKYIKRWGLHSGLCFAEEIGEEDCTRIAQGVLEIVEKHRAIEKQKSKLMREGLLEVGRILRGEDKNQKQ